MSMGFDIYQLFCLLIIIHNYPYFQSIDDARDKANGRKSVDGRTIVKAKIRDYYAQMETDLYLCSVCHKYIKAASTSNIIQHLKKHPEVYEQYLEECEKLKQINGGEVSWK